LKNLTATYKGLVVGGLMIVVLLICFYVFKLPINEKEQYAVYAVYLTGILWSLYSFKQKTSTTTTFKDYFSVGFKTFIVATLVMVAYTFVFFKLNTSYRDLGIAENNKLLLAEGNHTPAEIEQNANQLKKIFLPMMMGITTFKYLILGALITAVGAGFLSQKKANG
jgi:carbamoylphosphate synthase small subunit